MSHDSSGTAAALCLVLDAPLQSWGVNSRFRRRSTNFHPSKSAVLGLLAAALGINNQEPRETKHLQELRMLRLTTCRIPRKPEGQSAGLVRKLTDLQTVGGGYDPENEFGCQSIPRKAAGGPFGTVVTQREYLVDTLFVAIFEGKRVVLESLVQALENPVWGIWLGRKCCLPATPVRGSVHVNAQAALEECLKKLGLPTAMLCEYDRCTEVGLEGNAAGDSVFVEATPDDPISYGQRQYASRLILRQSAGRPD